MGLVEHAPPGDEPRVGETEEGEPRLREYRSGHAERDVRKQYRRGLRHEMPPEYISALRAERAQRLDPGAFAHCEDERADGARRTHPRKYRKYQYELPEPLAPDTGEHHQYRQRRYRKQDVDEAHDERIAPASDVAGRKAEGHPQQAGDDRRADADDQRGADTVDESCEDVASALVRAHQPLALAWQR
ncbi:hypothetical protein SDC9_150226 [bioreactor metagenome]|uniref:Uncharacterized protein n=1 Tax=bioreactor metagenome TaxID=1076179 RepID=A0A645ER46_9ZZZZ